MAEPHALLADRYRLVRQVGSGGMGVVWEAWDARLERPVAVKQLRPQVGLSPEEAELAKNRAMREARITARLHHRNAVPVFDVVEHEGQPCLIMQFLPSVPLSKVLKESGPLGVHEAAGIGAQVASALAAAHGLGIVHRDVKPGNILLTDDGTALISDFGISHALGDATLTSTGLVHGTPAYLAPEVARGAESSYASDVFSLGATLYAALEGAPPFGSDSNSIALLYKVASGEFDPPRRAGALAPVLMEMLRSDPDARPAMKEVAVRLAAREAADPDPPATRPLPVGVDEPPPAEASTTAVRVRPADEAPTLLAAPTPAPAPAPVPVATPAAFVSSGSTRAATAVEPAGPPRTPPAPQGRASSGRRRGAWALALLLLVGLVVLGAVLLGNPFGGSGTAAGPGATTSAPARRSASSDASPSAGRSASRSATSSPSSTRASSGPSASPSSSPSSPSPSATSSSPTGDPSAAELEAAVTGYYALLPNDLDQAWLRLTAAYQRSPSGGRRSYDQFWGQVDKVSVSKVSASPPSKVEATVTYHRSGTISVDRMTFRLVREGGILKIAGSTLVSSS